MGEKVLHWLTFGCLLVALPTLFTVLIQCYVFRDFEPAAYTKDMILIAVSIVANYIGIVVTGREALNKIFIWITGGLNILCALFLMILYFAFFSGYQDQSVINTIQNSEIGIIRFTWAVIVIDIVLGIIVSCKDKKGGN